jgi:hypothetical protein
MWTKFYSSGAGWWRRGPCVGRRKKEIHSSRPFFERSAKLRGRLIANNETALGFGSLVTDLLQSITASPSKNLCMEQASGHTEKYFAWQRHRVFAETAPARAIIISILRAPSKLMAVSYTFALSFGSFVRTTRRRSFPKRARNLRRVDLYHIY